VVRKVSVAVPMRNSPAETITPRTSTKMAPFAVTFMISRAPRADSRSRFVSAPTMTALATASALTAMVAARSAHMVRVVRSLNASARRRSVTTLPLPR
jgi:hypothetical protein